MESSSSLPSSTLLLRLLLVLLQPHVFHGFFSRHLSHPLTSTSSLQTRVKHPYPILHPSLAIKHPHRQNGAVTCSGINGWGRVGDRYSWTENEWELQVSISVPPQTRKEDILFKTSTTSLKLGLVNSTELLLGGKLKGRIAMDGTYWSLEGEGSERAVKLLLEKKEGALENSWDWRRVLAEEAATESDYQEAEKFDTKQYIHQMLGPEGINMDLVDKDLFGSGGLMKNMSKDTLKDYIDNKVLDDASGLFPKKEAQEQSSG